MIDKEIKAKFEKFYCELNGISIDNKEDFLNYGNSEVAVAFLAFEAAWAEQQEVIDAVEEELNQMKAYFSH